MRALKKYGFFLLLGAALFFPVVFFSSETRQTRELSTIERMVFALGLPLQKTLSTFTLNLQKWLHSYVILQDAQQRADELKRENAELNIQIQVYRELDQENHRLRQLLEFPKDGALKFLLGDIISADASFLYRSVRLNRGTDQGIQSGMAVVSAMGAVGVVMRVFANVCDVLLVTDANSNLDVMIARNRRRGILSGSAKGPMLFKYFERGGRPSVGDEVISSGLTGSFPRGVAVGTVSQVTLESDGMTQMIEVTPKVEFSNLTEAMVILSPSREVEVIKRIGGKDWMQKIVEGGLPRSGG
jgi:rod shape-determining protein MreC